MMEDGSCVSNLCEWLMVGGVIAGMFLLGGFFALLIEGISPQQYYPMSPDEEREWLKEVSSLSDEEIEEYMKP